MGVKILSAKKKPILDEVKKDLNIVNMDVTDVMNESFINYAMTVIVDRALPDVRDGLKPVHRRVLQALRDLHLYGNSEKKKSARIVGHIIGLYHPHGDTAAYETMVRMAQDWNFRYPLVSGQGNFGSIDGDSAAAMRYCVTGDTLVNTNKGLLKIKDIFPNSTPSSEEDIDLEVTSYRGIQNKSNKFFNSGEHEIIELTTENGMTLKGSFNHPVLVLSKTLNIAGSGEPKFIWKRLDQILLNDQIVIHKDKVIQSQERLVDSITSALMGLVLSHGYIDINTRDKGRKIVVSHIFDDSFIDFVGKHIKHYDDKAQMHIVKQRHLNYKKIIIESDKLYDFLTIEANYNRLSSNKEVPNAILRSNFETQKEFLSSFLNNTLFDIVEERLEYTSTSETIVKQIQVMLLQFGITSKTFYEKDKHTLILLRDQLASFCDKIGFLSKEKQDLIENIVVSETVVELPYVTEYMRKEYGYEILNADDFAIHRSELKEILSRNEFRQLEGMFTAGVTVSPVHSLKVLEKETVYSIRVDSACHTFIANGFVNHNTEAKMSPIAEEMMRDIDKETVLFIDNYDASELEPAVLPSRIPNILINGSLGIAVGMSTNMAPHNLGDAIDTVIAYIKNEDISVDKLIKIIKGPDFPTGGLIIASEEMYDIYRTGRGKFTMRGVVKVEEGISGRPEIVITEIPYGANKPRLIEKIADLVRNEKIVDIVDIGDESDRHGMRIVIKLRKDATPSQVIQQLYKYTDLECNESIINRVIVGKQPEILGLKDILKHYVAHQREIVHNRSIYDLKKFKKREHILLGLIIVGSQVDKIVRTIRNSKTPNTAKQALKKDFDLSEEQAQAVLDLKLQRITGLEVENTQKELNEVQKQIAYLEMILSDVKNIDKVIQKELLEIKKTHNDERKSIIILNEEQEEILMSTDLVKKNMLVAITKDGYIHSQEDVPTRNDNTKKANLFQIDNGDYVENILTGNSDQLVGLFTEDGTFFKLPLSDIPETRKNMRGTLLTNFSAFKSDSKVVSSVVFSSEEGVEEFLYFITEQGFIKKMLASEVLKSRNGILSMKLKDGDKLLSVMIGADAEEFIVSTLKGQTLRFQTKGIRPMGRVAGGVVMMNLGKDDQVISINKTNETDFVVVLTTNTFLKKIPLDEFKVQNRGGKGVRLGAFSKKQGSILTIHNATNVDDLLISYASGTTEILSIKDLKETSREAAGYKGTEKEESDKPNSIVLIKG